MPGRKIVVTHAIRSPFGAFNGTFANENPVSLGVEVVQAILKNSGIKPESIEQVWFGQAKPDIKNPNIASIISYRSGIPARVPAVTVNLGVGSGLAAIISAAKAIFNGDIEIALAGAVDCASYFLAPENGNFYEENLHGPLGLWCPLIKEPWKKSIEHVASRFEIKKDSMIEFSKNSLNKARKARIQGLLDKMIVPIHIRSGEDISRTLRADEYLLIHDENEEKEDRGEIPDITISKPADCAVAMILMTGDEALRRGFEPLAQFGQAKMFGADPRYSVLGGVNALREVCANAGIMPSSFDVIEIGESFSVEPLIAIKQLSLDQEKVNVLGGDLAYGFAFGASSAAKVVTLLHEISRREVRKGLVGVSTESGMGIAATFYRFSGKTPILFTKPEIEEDEEILKAKRIKRRKDR